MIMKVFVLIKYVIHLTLTINSEMLLTVNNAFNNAKRIKNST